MLPIMIFNISKNKVISSHLNNYNNSNIKNNNINKNNNNNLNK